MMNRVVIACVVVVSMAVDTAQANPFHIGRFGGLHAGPANQGAYAVYWNPGYLGQPDGHVQLHILGVNRHATYRRVVDDADNEPGLAEANAEVRRRIESAGFGRAEYKAATGRGNWPS